MPPVIITGGLVTFAKARIAVKYLVDASPGVSFRTSALRRVASADLQRGGYLKAIALLTRRTKQRKCRRSRRRKRRATKDKENKSKLRERERAGVSSDPRHEIVSASARERLNLQSANTCEE